VSKKEIQLAPGTVVQVDGVISDQVIPSLIRSTAAKIPIVGNSSENCSHL
jgi:hypothetical protein